MNESIYATVVDKIGFKVDFVLVDVDENEDYIPQYYSLKDGESLVYDGWDIANDMIKPRWDGKTWAETATPEEIQSAKSTCSPS